MIFRESEYHPYDFANRRHIGPSPSEIAAMLRYARNLAAHESIGETPGLWDLLLSASAMLSNEYASRLATLALEDHFAGPSLELPELSYNVEERALGQSLGVYRCEGEVLAGVPLLAPPRSVSLSATAAHRR